MKKNNKGFSLVELIVVIAIMAILAAIAIPTFAHFINKANEASDDELLHNINYIFQAACLENGVDVSEVTAANITYSPNKDTPIVLNSVTVNGDNTLSADIVASFNLHFSDMKNEKFKIIENIAFDADAHAFVEATEENNVYSNIFNSVDPTLMSALKTSTFGTIGAQGLMTRVDHVTELAEELFATNAGDSLKVALSADQEAIAASMGMSVTEFEAFIAAQDDPDAYYNNLLSNYAVLQVANTTANKESADLLADLRTGMTATDISNMIASDDTEASQDGVAKAAMMYAMYTAYANQLTPGAEKDKALENLDSMDAFVAAINDETQEDTGFMIYLNSTQAVTDMDGFVASMNIISSGTKDNTNATRDLLENGYNNSDLIDSLQGAMGN